MKKALDAEEAPETTADPAPTVQSTTLMDVLTGIVESSTPSTVDEPLEEPVLLPVKNVRHLTRANKLLRSLT